MKIQSPLSGLVIPLSVVPDEVFSKKMVGDGVAIDPIDSVLVSPVDGVVEFIHPAGHAVTLKTADQIEILIHIGIDTVNLKGEGFKSRVSAGQKVKIGDCLIEFDLDFIATQAQSAMTLVLVTQNEKYNFNFPNDHQILSGKTLFEVSLKGLKTEKKIVTNDLSLLAVSEPLTCLNATGLHARPAATITRMAQKFQSEVFIFKNNKSANAKSVTSILTLSVSYLDTLIIEAFGAHAAQAIQEMTTFIRQLAEEKHSPQIATPVQTQAASALSLHQFKGVMSSPGQVYGQIYQMKSQTVRVEKNISTLDPRTETQKWRLAMDQAQTDIQALIKKQILPQDNDKKNIYLAHLEILNDPEILSTVAQSIQSGASAAYAWQESINTLKSTLLGLNNSILVERVHDLQDVGQRVLKIMLGIKNEDSLKNLSSPEPVILVARHLTPSDMVDINPRIIKGLCLIEGGASSHVAIIARSMGIASLSAMDEKILEITNGTQAILYAQKGYLNTQPTEVEIQKTKSEVEQQNQLHRVHLETSQKPARTLDGHHIEVFANIGKQTEAVDALAHGAEGVGLLRSEFLFLDRTTAPSIQEQKEKYQEIISALGHERPVIIRTLDVGGDKPLSYLPMPHEENPFLGVRGLRLSLKSPNIFREQLKALLQVNPLSSLRIMFPMVTTLSELLEAKQILAEEMALLNISKISIGIMIEVPSAALTAEVFAPHVDFFSIGSNDLTQYTLAIDRGHRELASQADGLHPSVLRLIKMTCLAAQKHKKIVGVCGGIAGDPYAIPLLIGLGVDDLSVSVPSIPSVKAQIRKLNKAECIPLAEKALTLTDARQVREIVQHLI